MKKAILLKTYCILLLCTVSLLSYSKDIYVSPSGLDTNDGLSALTPVKTISMAISMAEDLDIINVLGFISLSKEPSKTGGYGDVQLNGSSELEYEGIVYNTWNPNQQTVQGTDEDGLPVAIKRGAAGVRMLNKELTIRGAQKTTCGFTGDNVSTLFRIDGVEKKVRFENLTFRNGNSQFVNEKGGALYIRSCAPDFHNCVFINNTNSSQKDGGAIFYNSMTVDKKSTFSECSFSGNLGGNGGDFHIQSGDLDLIKCVMGANDLSTIGGSRGGSIFIRLNESRPLNLYVYKTVFKDNITVGNGGAVFIEDGGSTPVSGNITFSACCFKYNKSSGDKGGAVWVENKTDGHTFNMSFINSTFYQNSAKEGGALHFQKAIAGSELSIVNCTFTENRTIQTYTDHGAGILFNEAGDATASTSIKNLKKKIYNTILENNRIAPGDRSDLSAKGNYTPTAADLIVERCFIGAARGNFAYLDYADNSEIHYDNVTNTYNSKAYFSQEPDLFIDYFDLISLSDNTEFNFGISEGLGYGFAQYLQEIGVNEDQWGYKRLFQNGRCNIGSVEISETELCNLVGGSSIKRTKVSSSMGAKVFYDGNSLFVSGEVEMGGLLRIQIFNISGTLISSCSRNVDTGAFSETISIPALPKGVYIIQLQLGKDSNAVKLIN